MDEAESGGGKAGKLSGFRESVSSAVIADAFGLDEEVVWIGEKPAELCGVISSQAQ